MHVVSLSRGARATLEVEVAADVELIAPPQLAVTPLDGYPAEGAWAPGAWATPDSVVNGRHRRSLAVLLAGPLAEVTVGAVPVVEPSLLYVRAVEGALVLPADPVRVNIGPA